MISSDLKIPFFVRVPIFLVGLYALISMLYIAQEIILPIIFSIILAILLQPLVDFFVRIKINRVTAIILTLVLSFVVFAGLGLLLFNQASDFSESWPVLVDKFTLMLNESITWLAGYLDIRPVKIQQWITDSRNEMLNSSSAVIGQVIMSVGSVILVLLLVPVYIFLLLYYKPLILDFIKRLFGKTHQTQVSQIVTQTKKVIQNYLVGLVIEAFIIAILYIAALLSLGIKFAILLGIVGALLNVIPYIGGLVGVALPMIVAFATKPTGWYAIYVLVIFYIIQLIDNNYIVPKVVASKVKINALFSIIVVIAGNALWGISGMFLSIPLLAIIKLICDQVEPLKPWGFLLGDTMPRLKIKPIFKK
jgi:predicted PurR-regulated permease PerM